MVKFSTNSTKPSGNIHVVMIRGIPDKQAMAVPFIIGAFIISLNTVQLWCIQTKLRRPNNPLMVVFFHLALVDLIHGVATSLISAIMLLEEEFSKQKSSVLLELIESTTRFGSEYLSVVSMGTMIALTLLKMFIVTRNSHYTEARINNICKTIWASTLAVTVVEYVLYKSGTYPDRKELREFRGLWFPALTFLTIFVFVTCFSKMYYVTRRSERRAPAQRGTTR